MTLIYPVTAGIVGRLPIRSGRCSRSTRETAFLATGKHNQISDYGSVDYAEAVRRTERKSSIEPGLQLQTWVRRIIRRST